MDFVPLEGDLAWTLNEIEMTGWGKNRFTVVNTQNTEFILALVCISYCIIFHMNICKPIFVPPYTDSKGMMYSDLSFKRNTKKKGRKE